MCIIIHILKMHCGVLRNAYKCDDKISHHHIIGSGMYYFCELETFTLVVTLKYEVNYC
jgi:hypothetical protein